MAGAAAAPPTAASLAEMGVRLGEAVKQLSAAREARQWSEYLAQRRAITAMANRVVEGVAALLQPAHGDAAAGRVRDAGRLMTRAAMVGSEPDEETMQEAAEQERAAGDMLEEVQGLLTAANSVAGACALEVLPPAIAEQAGNDLATQRARVSTLLMQRNTAEAGAAGQKAGELAAWVAALASLASARQRCTLFAINVQGAFRKAAAAQQAALQAQYEAEGGGDEAADPQEYEDWQSQELERRGQEEFDEQDRAAREGGQGTVRQQWEAQWGAAGESRSTGGGGSSAGSEHVLHMGTQIDWDPLRSWKLD